MAVDLLQSAQDAFRRRESAAGSVGGGAETIAAASHAVAERFRRGGKLIAFGAGACATDAAHIAVEFLHPVIVGKRALPALALAHDAAPASAGGADDVFVSQLRCFAEPGDIALGVSPDGNCAEVASALAEARRSGLLTVALTGGGGGLIALQGLADHLLVACSGDHAVVKEIHVTMYHILWEQVHVFFERPGLLEPAVV